MSDLAGQPISPGFFVPVAERLGIMVQLDRWIFRRALHFLHQHPKLSLNFNISAQTLNDPDLISYIVKQIDNANVEPKRITFEITETAMIFNLSNACSFLHEVNKLGCGSALDDFGSGFTSLSYLRELPVNILKIDGSFIQNLDVDPFNQTLVKAISDIAHLLGKKTVVEFVENERILETAESLGIDYGQGWYLGKPKPFRSFDQAL
jgi:EAL domain-containing protein (putative c-di-GMP-specific phosphodiesterase class I)